MISFIIPLKNEVENLPTLYNELLDVLIHEELNDVEIVFIDDGSTDGSWGIVEQLALGDQRVRGIKFRRNFGKAAALTAGFQASHGAIVFTLDGDLQDDPIEIPRFLAKLNEGFDLVSGWKKRRHDPWHKVGPSRIFNWMVSRVTHCRLHDHNCGFKVYHRSVLNEVRIYGELHRFVPALAYMRGFRVGEIEVHHRARLFGVSKYGFSRFLKGLLDLITVRFLTHYGQRPLHLMGTIGVATLGIGGLGLTLLIVAGLMGWSGGWLVLAAVLTTVLLILGVQLMGLGLIGQLITSYSLDESTTFSIAATIGEWGPS